MSALSFIRELAPVIERRELLRALDSLQEEYDDTLSPILIDVKDVFSGVKLNSPLYRRLDQSFRRFINFNGTTLDVIIRSLENVGGLFDIVRKEIRSLFSVQIATSALSFQRVQLLEFIEGLAFYIRYGRKILMFITAAEARVINNKATPTRWTAPEQDWVNSNMDQFASLYMTMSLPPSKFKASLAKASDAVVAEDTFDLAVQTLGDGKTDPLNLSGFSPRHNPFTILGKILAEMQHIRYKEAQEEHFGLQMRLQEIRELQETDKANPIYQKQITEYEKRISDFEREIEMCEEKAGLR